MPCDATARPRPCPLVLILMVLAGVLLHAAPASAQIWVVQEPDGSQRFTSSPEPGARLFMRTRHGARSAAVGLAGTPYADTVAAAAAANGVDPELVHAVIAAESNFDPHAVSPKGAQGLMQLMPATAAELGVGNVWDPGENIRGGTAHLAKLLTKFDDLSLAIAAYNAGEGAVQRYGGIPPFRETEEYVRRVLGRYQRLRSGQ